MNHRVIEQILQRAEADKEESDFTYFTSLLYVGEVIVKTVILGMIAAISEDKDRNRYRLEHLLVRADSIGDWVPAIDDALTGPASQFLIAEARTEQKDLTKLCKGGDWQYNSVLALKSALDYLKIEAEEIPTKSDMKRWFRLFTTLRNKTRGHGAPRHTEASIAAEPLAESINLFYRNFSLFQRPWAYLHRNLSGKYRVSSIGEDASPFEYLKRETIHTFQNGVYIFLGSPRLVPLMQSDVELSDFFFTNGSFNGKRFELISYSTGDKREGDATNYLTPPGSLPPSETEGHGELLARGNCLSNVPDPASDYIARPQLEKDLSQLLMDSRRPIVTLVGSGGIGKTSLSLKVIQKLFSEKRYDVVVWFSARDIDLLPIGPKLVRPHVLSPEDISTYYTSLVLSEAQWKERGFITRAFFEQQLQKNELGSCLYVFDNFETTQNPIEMFDWIDSFIRLPNKVLITTRLRNFRGDYPLEVLGMTDEEARILINQTAKHLGIVQLLTTAYIENLISYSEGHPYVIKILLGEVANKGRLPEIAHLVTTREEILTALFERTYASLTPCAQRAFMTLASMNSAVPRLALEAILLNSISERQEIEKSIESLLYYSLAEIHVAPTDRQEFINLPYVAKVFGKKKLRVSPFKAAVQADVEMLQMLGPSKSNDVHLGLAKPLERFIVNISRRIEAGESFQTYLPVLKMICRTYNPGWLVMARWHMERRSMDDYEKAKENLRQFLENDPEGPGSVEAWRMLEHACNLTEDSLGEIHASIERTKLTSVPFSDVSNAANLLNRLLYRHELDEYQDEKHDLAQCLLTVLKKRQGEADANDYSRMAWLALNIGQREQAIEYVHAGLNIEIENPHCRKIAERLGLNI